MEQDRLAKETAEAWDEVKAEEGWEDPFLQDQAEIVYARSVEQLSLMSPDSRVTKEIVLSAEQG